MSGAAVVSNFHDLNVTTESDVEQKIIYPLLTHNMWLNFGAHSIKTKEYLPPTDLDKGSGKLSGYFPDYSIWVESLPTIIVEAKKPFENALEGFRQASLYAHEFNKRYPHDVHPVAYIIACNGNTLVYGMWDTDSPTEVRVDDLVFGSTTATDLIKFFSHEKLRLHANRCAARLTDKRTYRPINSVGGEGRFSHTVPLNSFAQDLAPLVRMYFDTESPDRLDDIIKKGYVSSDEVTTFDAILEAYLEDRASVAPSPNLRPLAIKKNRESNLNGEIERFGRDFPSDGYLQLLIGGVGSGKSLFAKRHFRALQSEAVRARSYWSFIDFNKAPDDLSGIEEWVCSAFVDGMSINQYVDDLYQIEMLNRIFATDLNKKNAIYKLLPADKAAEMRANDLSTWMEDKLKLAQGVCRYFIGDARKIIVVVFDNTDRRDRDQQLRIFQVAQWFRSHTRTFCIVSLRDETYERYKTEPPLDTLAHSIHFYIAAPRFGDVVRKRLELVIEYLAENSEKSLEYQLPSGPKIRYPSTKLGEYIKSLYVDIFRTEKKTAWVLESLAGKNVRRSLEMFTRIIMSGHLDERAITSTVLGEGSFSIHENIVLKILMRTNYKYFSDRSGFVTNILTLDPNWKRPSNFLFVECLHYLAINRKKEGDIGVQGYFSVTTISAHLERMGFHADDVLSALEVLLQRGLITADHMKQKGLTAQDCVRLHASGFIHVRFLISRLEYVSACLPSVHMLDKTSAEKIGVVWNIHEGRIDIGTKPKKDSVYLFLEYLRAHYMVMSKNNPFFEEAANGSRQLLEKIEAAAAWVHTSRSEPEPLMPF